MRKIIAVLLAASIMFGLTACGGSVSGGVPETRDPKQKKSLYVVMITDETGLSDGSRGSQIWAEVQRAEEELGIMTNCLEPETAADYDKKIGMALESEADLIICAGEGMTDAVSKAAEANPNQKFVITDGAVEADNVISLIFEGQEAMPEAGEAVYSVIKELVASGAFEGGIVSGEGSE